MKREGKMVENLDETTKSSEGITSDILSPEREPFLYEPVMPHREDFKNQETYDYALEQFKQKLEKFQARTQLKKEEKNMEERQKELEKSVIYKVRQLFNDIKYEHCVDRDDDGKIIGFKPAKAAALIASRERFITDIKTSTMFFFDGKSWIPNAEPYLEIVVAAILGEENRVAHYNNIKHHLIGITLNNVIFSKKIALENGLLDPETMEFTDFNIKEMPLYAIPVTYDPTAKSDHWLQFITQVVNPDDLATIQEWSGFLLLADYRFHKLLWIHGDGRNGKGVWQRTMETILGQENVSSIGLEEFDGNHRFALRQLFGKLFNPCSEPTTNKVLQTPLLKKVTGQDTIEAEIKGKQARLTFRNCAKITVMANRFPKIHDNTTAFRERRLFIKFPNEFTGKNQIQNIEQNWLNDSTQRSGILNWMLEGLQRLLTQGYFTESKTQQETEAEFLRASDTISAFLTEMVIFDKNKVTSRSEAYDKYKEYCDFNGIEAENEKRFTARLKETPKVSVTTISKPKRERAWKGFSLNQLNEDGSITVVTPVTDVTCFHPQTNVTEFLNNKQDRIPVTNVTSVTDPQPSMSQIDGYTQLTCVFCQKGIMDNDWVQDDFTWNKPAHKQCYDAKKSELASQDEREANA